MKYIEIRNTEDLEVFLADDRRAIRDIIVTERLYQNCVDLTGSFPVYHLFYYENKHHEERRSLQSADA